MKNACPATRLLILLAGMSMAVGSCSDSLSSGKRIEAGAKDGGSGLDTPQEKSGVGGNAAGGTAGGTGGSVANAVGGDARGSGGAGGESDAAGAGSDAGNVRGSGGTAAGSGGTAAGSGGTAAGSGGAAGGAGTGSGGTGGDPGDAAPDPIPVDGPGADRADVTGVLDGRDAGPAPDLVLADAACPSGQSFCGTTCVDTSADTEHCGGCTNVCGVNQTCKAGVCVEGGGQDPSDGCTDDLARNLTLRQIAVYQTVKIPVMMDGVEVAPASRNASVIKGRDAVFRAFVTLGSGWVARELAARLTLTAADGTATQLHSRKTIRASSVDRDVSTTFQIFVPASAMAAPLSYAMQVVECNSQSGSAGQAQFPATGSIDLGVRTTGGLKIKIIPIQVGTLLPDTSAAGLAGYADEMAAMYPIDSITLSVGDTLTATSPLDWTAMLDNVLAKRARDRPANDVYYFGLVKPAATLREYCGAACVTGIGAVVTSATGSAAAAARGAVGVGYGDKYSWDTMAHEVGHNHGRRHAPCATGGDGDDPNYPYRRGALGSWGYDHRTQALYDPTRSTDIMGYCANQWMSDYTYKGIATRVAAVNGVALMDTLSLVVARWRILYVDARGPRWGIAREDELPATGEPESAVVYGPTGAVLGPVEVYRTDIADSDIRMFMVPEPEAGWYAVSIAGSAPLPFAAPAPLPWPEKKTRG